MSTPDILDQVAKRLESEAADLRRRAQLLREERARRSAVHKRLTGLSELGLMAARAAHGDPAALPELAARLAAAHGAPALSITSHAKRALAAQADALRGARDRAILRMAAKGHTNAEIAARHKLSARQVSRIIGAAFRANRG